MYKFSTITSETGQIGVDINGYLTLRCGDAVVNFADRGQALAFARCVSRAVADLSPPPSKAVRAAEFLEGLLAEGPMASAAVINAAKARGIAESALWNARRRLGVVSVGVGNTAFWRLPSPAARPR